MRSGLIQLKWRILGVEEWKFSLVPLTAATIDGTLHLANLAAEAVARTLQSHQLSHWPFQIKQTAEGEKSTQIPIPDIPVDRSVAPTFLRFPRRKIVDEVSIGRRRVLPCTGKLQFQLTSAAFIVMNRNGFPESQKQ